jgi:hypothetical protein
VKVDLIESSDKGRRINPRRFDDLVEQITSQPAEAHVIVDTGSSAFVPLLHYVVSSEVQAILSEGGHQLVVHTIVTRFWCKLLKPVVSGDNGWDDRTDLGTGSLQRAAL